MQKIVKYGLFLISFIGCNAYAEGGSCPEGMYPIGGQGYQGCAPIPNYSSPKSNLPAPPPPKSKYQIAAESMHQQTNSDIADVLIAMAKYEEKQHLVAATSEKKQNLEAELANNPKYQMMKQGYWHFEPRPSYLPKGDGCSAIFANLDGAVTVSGPSGEYRNAAITFWGGSIPIPKKPKMIPVTLSQTGANAAATVSAYNFAMADGKIGAVSLVVPDANGLISNMYDTHKFAVFLSNKKGLEIEWKGGKVASQMLSTCIAGQ